MGGYVISRGVVTREDTARNKEKPGLQSQAKEQCVMGRTNGRMTNGRIKITW